MDDPFHQTLNRRSKNYPTDPEMAQSRRDGWRADRALVRRHSARGGNFTAAGKRVQFPAGLKQRLTAFGLSLHPKKTRLLEFGKFAAERRKSRGLGKPETFDFLGFKHICANKESRDGFQLWRRMPPKRMQTELQEVKEELRRYVRASIDEQGRWLDSVVRGIFAYYAVPANSASLDAFRKRIKVLWIRRLRRRSQRHRMTWARMRPIFDRYLPKTKIIHSWPEERFRVKYSR